MASDGIPAGIPATVSSSSAAVARDGGASAANRSGPTSGKSLPPTGGTAGAGSAVPTTAGTAEPGSSTATRSSGQNAASAKAAAPLQAAGTSKTTLQSLVVQLNKYLNDSGRPSQFRVEPGSSNGVIQEVNPANGAVIGEYSAAEFPALARSLGISGVLVNSHA